MIKTMKNILTLFFILFALSLNAQRVDITGLIGGVGVKVDTSYQSSWKSGIAITAFDGNDEINWAATAKLTYMLFYPEQGIDTYKGLHYEGAIGISTPNQLLKFQVVFGYIDNLNTSNATGGTMTFGFETGIQIPVNENISIVGTGSLLRTGGYITTNIGPTTLLTGAVGVAYNIKKKKEQEETQFFDR